MTDRRRWGALRGVPIGVALLALVLVGLALAARVASGEDAADRNGERPPAAQRSVSIPELASAKVAPSEPAVLTHGNVATRAAVWQAVTARAAPSASARAVARVATVTPEGTDEIVLALEERPDRLGQTWVRVRLPVLPNNTTGWVPRQALGPYDVLRTRLTVDLARLQLVLYRNGRAVLRAPVGIGKGRWPTPRGEFYVRNKLTDFRDPFYGPVAFGTSARSAVLTDWPAGGFVGIHGTNRPQLLPGRVSHGCIRMRNGDIARLARLLPPGTPLTIR